MSTSSSAYVIYGFKIPDDDKFEEMHGCNSDTFIRKNKLKYVKVYTAGSDESIVCFMGFIINELEDFVRSKPYTVLNRNRINKMDDKHFQAADAAATLMKSKCEFYMIGTSF